MRECFQCYTSAIRDEDVLCPFCGATLASFPSKDKPAFPIVVDRLLGSKTGRPERRVMEKTFVSQLDPFSPSGMASGSGETPESPFCGRRKELKALVDFLGGSEGSKAIVVHITGEAGIGKSRLVREALVQAKLRRESAPDSPNAKSGSSEKAPSMTRLIEWRASEWSRNILLQPVLEWLREEFHLEPDPTIQSVSESIRDYYGAQNAEAAADCRMIEYLFGVPRAVIDLQGSPPDHLQRNLFAAIRSLIIGSPQKPRVASDSASGASPDLVRGTTPVVLIVDDLQWVDPLTNQLIRMLIRRPGENMEDAASRKEGSTDGSSSVHKSISAPPPSVPSPLSPSSSSSLSSPSSSSPSSQYSSSPPLHPFPFRLILIYRSGAEPPIPVSATSLRIHLQPLENEERRALVERLASADEFFPEMRRLLLSSAPGNPLFIEGMLHLVREVIRANNDLNGEAQVNRIIEVIPVSLRDLLQRRIDLLDDRSRQVLQCLSLLGMEFSAGLIELFDQIRDGLDGHLQTLTALRYIEERPAPYGIHYRFSHGTLREAAYSTLSEYARRSLHVQIARRLMEALGDRVHEYHEVLAFHYTRGASGEAAVYHRVKAADRQASLGATENALENYDGAIDLLRDLPPTPQHQAIMTRVLVRCARLRRLRGEVETGEEILRAGAECAEALGNDRLALQVRLEQAILKTWRGGGDQSVRAQLERLVSDAARLHLPVAERVALNSLGMYHWQRGEYEPALEAFQTLAKRAGEAAVPQAQGDAFNNAGLIYWRWGQLTQALKAFKRAIPLRRQLGDAFGLCATLMNIGIVQENLGRIEGARKAYRKARVLAEKTSYAQGLASLESNLSNLERRIGTAATALEHAVHAIQYAQLAGDPNLLCVAEHNAALACALLPLHETEASNHFDRALEMACNQGNREREIDVRLDRLGMEFHRQRKPIPTIDRNTSVDRLSENVEIQTPPDSERIDSRIAAAEEFLRTAVELLHQAECHPYPDLLPKAYRLKGEILEVMESDLTSSGAATSDAASLDAASSDSALLNAAALSNKALEALEESRRLSRNAGGVFEEIDSLTALISWAKRRNDASRRRQWQEDLDHLLAMISAPQEEQE